MKPRPKSRDRADAGMSSSSKMLAILGLFHPARMAVSAEDVITALGYSPATAYRYLAELCEAGLLFPFVNNYILGPRVLQLDDMIRQADPVRRTSRPIVDLLVAKFRCDVMMTVLFGDQPVVVTYDRGGDDLPVGFDRGQVLPLFQGATSKVLIGSLPAAKQRRLFEAHTEDAQAAGLPQDWASFRNASSAHRRRGCVVSVGELAEDVVDVAAPLDLPAPVPPESLTLLFSKERYRLLNASLVAGLLLDAAREIRDSTPLRSLPPLPASARRSPRSR